MVLRRFASAAVIDPPNPSIQGRPSSKWADHRNFFRAQVTKATCLVHLVVLFSTAAFAQTQNTPSLSDLSKASLEQLMDIEVTSVSRKEQKISRVAAAVYVITQEDIRRSGATNIPDLLRMVPGLDVAQINANTWAISARGFNGQFANKMLVLIDGRTVYDPANSGVYWDVQDAVLEDIERIEVIGGPGATVWGTNAVNGVINIITKDSKETQGGLLSGGGGNVDRGFGTLRWGGKIGKHGSYRVFGKYFNRSSFDDRSGRDAADAWEMRHGGFRTDWEVSNHDSITVQGDVYGGVEGNPYPVGPLLRAPFFTTPFTAIRDISGGDVLARWNHTFQGGSQMSLQAYFDRISRTDPFDPELRSTVDLDFQHHLQLGSRNDIVWGLGYRANSDHLASSFMVSFDPARFSSKLANVFVQDEISLVPDKLWLTVGTKLEHNDFTGQELEPSVRLLWTPNSHHSLWLAYSDASRIPARNDKHLRVNLATFSTQGGPVALVSLFGNPQFDSENLDAYELGYRFQPNRRLSLDIAAFYNDYHHLRSLEPGAPFFETSPPPPHLVIPQTFDNGQRGSTYGTEGSAEFKVTKFWALQAGYAWFVPSLRLEPSSRAVADVAAVQNESPRNQFQFRSALSLPRHFEFDTGAYRVGRLATGAVPAYTRLDVRLGWRVAERMELSVAGQNLLDARHVEFSGSTQEFETTQIKRSVYGSLTFRF